MSETPQDRGRAFEPEIAKIVGGKLVPGSGNRLYKLDVSGHQLVWSIKHTDDVESIRIDKHMMQEMKDATIGVNGLGANVTPLLVARFAETELVSVLNFFDLVALLRDDSVKIPASKDDQRRARASIPGALRDL